MYKDLTPKYTDMIESLSLYFRCANDKKNAFSLDYLQKEIDRNSNEELNKNIKLLNDLAFCVSRGLLKIVKESEEK